MEDQPLSPPPAPPPPLALALQALAAAEPAGAQALVHWRMVLAQLPQVDLLQPPLPPHRLWLREQVLSSWLRLLAQMDTCQAQLATQPERWAPTPEQRNRLAWQVDALDTEVLRQLQAFVQQFYTPAPVDQQELRATAHRLGLTAARQAQLGL